MVSIVTTIAVSVAGAILVKEIDGWAPKLASQIIALALKRLPAHLRERYEEEWAGHLEQMPTAVSKMTAALGFAIAATRIRFISEGKSVSGITQDAAMRTADLFFGAVCLVLFFPLFMALAIGIRLSGPGPIIYASKRIGKNGQEFRCYKLRTMSVAADGTRATTPFGRFLRKGSLDELPQFANLVNGTMSLVGPRPIVKSEEPLYGDEIVHYKSVRPGVTGLWQVSNSADNTFKKRVALDSEFAKQRSLLLYIIIALMTVPAVLTAHGVRDDDDKDDEQDAG